MSQRGTGHRLAYSTNYLDEYFSWNHFITASFSCTTYTCGDQGALEVS